MQVDAALPFPELPGLAGRRIVPACAEHIRHDAARRIFSWWSALALDHQPRRADFDIVDHAAVAKHLFLIERIDDGFELRLGGEEYTRIIPRKRGTQWRKEASDPVIRDYAIVIDFVARSRRPYLGTGRLDLGEKYWRNFESLTCPLVGDATHKESFLGCISEIPDAD